jgi:hypothetical protein
VSINYDDLENWSCRAAQELQEVLDDAEEAGSSEGCCASIRGLLEEHNRIISGMPLWQMQIASGENDGGLIL